MENLATFAKRHRLAQLLRLKVDTVVCPSKPDDVGLYVVSRNGKQVATITVDGLNPERVNAIDAWVCITIMQIIEDFDKPGLSRANVLLGGKPLHLPAKTA